MTALLNWRVWAALCVAVALAGTHWKAYIAGQKNIHAEWTADKLQQAQASAQVLAAAARKTADLQIQAETNRKAKNAQIAALNDDLSAALDRLQDRPARGGPGDVPGDTGTGPAPGCTGAQLYRGDAQFLARFAGRAERLRAELVECQAAHSAAREALSQ